MASSIQDIITLVGIGLVGKVSSFFKVNFSGFKNFMLGSISPIFIQILWTEFFGSAKLLLKVRQIQSQNFVCFEKKSASQELRFYDSFELWKLLVCVYITSNAFLAQHQTYISKYALQKDHAIYGFA